VHRLFDITGPGRAYFGKKDYQQLAIIREMVRLTGLPVAIIPCDTIREEDGLAMSSRNLRLSIAERQKAPVLHQVLQAIKEKAGSRSVKYLKDWGVKHIEKHPEFRVEYLEIANRDTLLPISNWKEKASAVIFIAAFLGDVRLIDNVEVFS
jgi:pantoate--beta-alanine ligase